MALRVDPARGEIRLVVPRRTSDRSAWRFADENRQWIAQRLARLVRPVPFEHGQTIPVFGQYRAIEVVRTGGRITHIELTDACLNVNTPRPDPASNIRRFLYQTLEDYARPLAASKAAAIGRTIGAVTLRDTRTRWGSCSADGRLMLCWRLVFAPQSVVDYVIAHEVAHLRHMDHSPRFWALCEMLSEDMDFARDWLTKNGEALLRYGCATQSPEPLAG